MATKTNTLLEVKNLSVDYYAANGAVHAVSDVSFTLERGKILGLAGESGCGKSTLAYAVGRLLRPPAVIADGSVIYHPQLPGGEETAQNQRKKTSSFTEPVDVLRLSPAQLRAFRWNELSIVFQSAMNALNPVMTIGTQIIDVFQRHRPDMGSNSRKQRAVELLRLVGIAPDRLSSYPHELSGGMRLSSTLSLRLRRMQLRCATASPCNSRGARPDYRLSSLRSQVQCNPTIHCRSGSQVRGIGRREQCFMNILNQSLALPDTQTR